MSKILADLILLFLLLLFVRVVIEWVMQFNPSFRAKGAGAALLEAVYTVTDPPVRLLRRAIPPLRVGRVAVDLSFIVLFIGGYALVGVLRRH